MPLCWYLWQPIWAAFSLWRLRCPCRLPPVLFLPTSTLTLFLMLCLVIVIAGLLMGNWRRSFPYLLAALAYWGGLIVLLARLNRHPQRAYRPARCNSVRCLCRAAAQPPEPRKTLAASNHSPGSGLHGDDCQLGDPNRLAAARRLALALPGSVGCVGTRATC